MSQHRDDAHDATQRRRAWAATSADDTLRQLEGALHSLSLAHGQLRRNPTESVAYMRDAVEVLERAIPTLRAELVDSVVAALGSGAGPGRRSTGLQR